MSPKAKYGWAIGLIVIGVVFALPFRHVQTEDSQVAKADVENADETSADKVDNKSTAESADANSLTQSPLLPEKVESNDRKMIGQFDDSTAKSRHDAAQVVEEVPNKFPKETIEPSQEVVKNDRAASLHPVEFSKTNKSMPDSVGPYRMKPVPSGKFRRASQSNNNSVFSNASRSRKVVHYKLRDGDSLRSIAKRYLGDDNRFQEILADNRHILTNGENFLPVGQYITIIVQ